MRAWLDCRGLAMAQPQAAVLSVFGEPLCTGQHLQPGKAGVAVLLPEEVLLLNRR